ncbi:hypothetical protein ABZZ79_03395 [Streptomyces sp. NPDC006458]|uniref:hypothetical protein n=1 Tax=Streptomyces sp. NPDC006458 TaxID=3154302 RepID=UPI0033A769E5
MTRDDQVAALLKAGATYAQVAADLGVGKAIVRRVRAQRGIPVPAERAKRGRAEMDAAEAAAIGMLRSGATVKEIRRATRLGPNRISRLRADFQIPTPRRTYPAPITIAEALALHLTPEPGGHARWTGSRYRRSLILFAEGRQHNARRAIFEQTHGRPPVGYVTTECTRSWCVAGEHLKDAVMRGTAETDA